MDGRKFVASYSGGKDCMLAIHRAMASGLKPVAFIIMHNEARQRSWFHGITEVGIEQVSQAVGVPIWLIKTEGPAYTENFERALIKAREAGAEVCVFGDIDVQAHHDWCTARRAATGLEALFPFGVRAAKVLCTSLLTPALKPASRSLTLSGWTGALVPNPNPGAGRPNRGRGGRYLRRERRVSHLCLRRADVSPPGQSALWFTSHRKKPPYPSGECLGANRFLKAAGSMALFFMLYLSS